MPTDTPIPPTATLAPCDISEWWDRAHDQLVTFMDIAEIVASTSRMAMGALLIDLRSAQRDFEDLSDYPACAAGIYESYVLALEFTVRGFTAFLGQDDAGSTANFTFGNAFFHDAESQLPQMTALLMDERLAIPQLVWGGPLGEEAVATLTAVASTAVPTQIVPTRTPFRTSTLGATHTPTPKS